MLAVKSSVAKYCCSGMEDMVNTQELYIHSTSSRLTGPSNMIRVKQLPCGKALKDLMVFSVF